MKQYKSLITKTEDVDSKGRVVVAANAIGNTDSDNDISMDGSFNKTLKENFSRVKWFLNHNKDILIGVPIEGSQDGKYLKMTGQLNLNKQIGRDVYEDYKLYAEHGKSLEHSIGVEAIKKETKGDVRQIFEWKLWEYSTLTAWGANEDTPMLGIKSAKDITDTLSWFELQLKKGNYSDEKFKKIETNLFTLKTLLSNEPEVTTHLMQPNKWVDTIKQFTKTI